MVIVPPDGSQATEAALPYVEPIAAGTGPALRLLRVVQRQEEAFQVGEAFTYLEEKAGELRSRSLSCSPEVTGGVDRAVRRSSLPCLLVRPEQASGGEQ